MLYYIHGMQISHDMHTVPYYDKAKTLIVYLTGCNMQSHNKSVLKCNNVFIKMIFSTALDLGLLSSQNLKQSAISETHLANMHGT